MNSTPPTPTEVKETPQQAAAITPPPPLPPGNPQAENLILKGIAEALMKADTSPAPSLDSYLEVIGKSHVIMITNHKDAPEGLFVVVLPQSPNCYFALVRKDGIFELVKQDREVIGALGIDE